MDLVVHETPEATAVAIASRIADIIEETEGRVTLGLAGGGTPAASYRLLREMSVPWSRVESWLSDERWVPPDDERSNGRMAADVLMDHVAGVFHRPLWSPLLTPTDSATRYEAVLRHIHPGGRPDVILLGVGEDGHTASLFPGTPALEESGHWYVSNQVPSQPEPRLTATYPLLWSAHRLLVLAVGDAKATALEQSLRGITPAGRLDEGDAEVEWHVDTAAASLVS